MSSILQQLDTTINAPLKMYLKKIYLIYLENNPFNYDKNEHVNAPTYFTYLDF
jgi:hypothetical protein